MKWTRTIDRGRVVLTTSSPSESHLPGDAAYARIQSVGSGLWIWYAQRDSVAYRTGWAHSHVRAKSNVERWLRGEPIEGGGA